LQQPLEESGPVVQTALLTSAGSDLANPAGLALGLLRIAQPPVLLNFAISQ
jgi:hypothetical protein